MPIEALIPVGPWWTTPGATAHIRGTDHQERVRLSEPDPRAAANSAEASSRWTALRSLRNPAAVVVGPCLAHRQGSVSFRKRPNFWGGSGQNPTHPKIAAHAPDTGRPEQCHWLGTPVTTQAVPDGRCPIACLSKAVVYALPRRRSTERPDALLVSRLSAAWK